MESCRQRRKIMPKVLYTTAKGLYQETGSGFTVSGVAVTEAAESVATADTGGNVAAYGATTLSGDGALAMTLPDGSAVGAVKFLTCDDVDNSPVVTVTSGIQTNGVTVLDTLTFDAVSEHASLIWDGTNWICTSTTATEA
jgi:hypothetical protein